MGTIRLRLTVRSRTDPPAPSSLLLTPSSYCQESHSPTSSQPTPQLFLGQTTQYQPQILPPCRGEYKIRGWMGQRENRACDPISWQSWWPVVHVPPSYPPPPPTTSTIISSFPSHMLGVCGKLRQEVLFFSFFFSVLNVHFKFPFLPNYMG